MNRRNFLKMLGISAMSMPLLAKAVLNHQSPSLNGLSEWEKCAKSPSYFIKNYFEIKSATKGTVNFDLYTFQEYQLRMFEKHNHLVTVKARQMGMTTLSVAYAMWTMIFKNQNMNVLFVCHSTEAKNHTMNIFRFAYDNLPEEFKIGLLTNNHYKIEIENGSKFHAVSSLLTCGCSECYNMVIVDEAGFCNNLKEFLLSMTYCLSENSKLYLISSRGGHNDWLTPPVRRNYLPWSCHPERDAAWKERMVAILGKKQFDIEYNCV